MRESSIRKVKRQGLKQPHPLPQTACEMALDMLGKKHQLCDDSTSSAPTPCLAKEKRADISKLHVNSFEVRVKSDAKHRA